MYKSIAAVYATCTHCVHTHIHKQHTPHTHVHTYMSTYIHTRTHAYTYMYNNANIHSNAVHFGYHVHCKNMVQYDTES